MADKKMKKFKVTIVAELPYKMEWFEGATTPEEAAAMQQRWLDDGTMSTEDALGGEGEISIKVEPLEEEG